ncbi:MAG: outer membrane beta-barrel protein [Gemmatimonadaceae bacterium]
MKRSLFAVVLLGTAFVSFEAGAQVATAVKPIQFGIAAGASLPTSDLSDGANTGYNVTGTLAFNPQLVPLGIRVDGAYNRFAFDGVDGNIAFTSLTGNLVYKVPSASVSPYLIGGGGWCQASVSLSGSSASDNHFCWNAGGGINMPLSGFTTFIEARYNQVQGDGGSLKFIPITFGVMF